MTPCLAQDPDPEADRDARLAGIQSLIQQAEELGADRRFEEAHAKLSDGLVLVTELPGDWVGTLCVASDLSVTAGDLAMLEGESDEGAQAYRRALTLLIAPDYTDYNNQSSARLFAIGERLEELDYGAAESAFRTVAEQCATRDGGEYNVAVSLTRAAQVCRWDGRPAAALDAVRTAERTVSPMPDDAGWSFVRGGLEGMKGALALDGDDLDAAVVHFQAAEEHYRRADDERNMLGMLSLRAQALHDSGRYDDAIEPLRTLAAHHAASSDPGRAAEARLELSKGYARAGRMEDAVSQAQAVIEHLRAQGDEASLAQLLAWSGSSRAKFGQLQEADSDLSECLEIYRRQGAADSVTVMKLLADVRRDLGREQEAIDLYTSFIDAAYEAHRRGGREEVSAIAGLDDMTSSLDSLHVLYRRAGRLEDASDCLVRLCSLSIDNGDLDDALTNVDRYLQFAESNGTTGETTAELLKKTAQELCNAGQPERAIGYLEDARKVLGEHDHSPIHDYETLRVLSYALAMVDRNDEAIARLDEGLTFLPDTGYEPQYAMMLRKKAGLLHLCARNDEALSSIDDAIGFFRENDRWVAELVDALFLRMVICINSERADEGGEAAREVVRLFRAHGQAIDLGHDSLMASMLLAAQAEKRRDDPGELNARLREAHAYALSVDHAAWRSWLLARVVQATHFLPEVDSDLALSSRSDSLRARRALAAVRLRAVPSAQRGLYLAKEFKEGPLAPETRSLLRTAFAGDTADLGRPPHESARASSVLPALQAAILEKTFLFQIARQQRAQLLEEAPPALVTEWRRLDALRRRLATLSLQSHTALERLTPEERHRRTDDMLRLSQALGEQEDVLRELMREQEVVLDDVDIAALMRRLGDGVLMEFVRYVEAEPDDSNPWDWNAEAEEATGTITMHSSGGTMSGELHSLEVSADGVVWEGGETALDLSGVQFPPESDTRVPDRLGVFLVRGGTGDVIAIDLGPLEPIDRAVARYRALNQQQTEYRNFNEPQLAQRSEEIRKLVFDPIREHLGSASRIFIAPDGSLALFPFEALAEAREDADWRYLGEQFAFSYLSSGRDLLSTERRHDPARDVAVIFGAPAFDAQPIDLANAATQLGSRDRVEVSSRANVAPDREIRRLVEGAEPDRPGGGEGLDVPTWSDLPGLDRFVSGQAGRLADFVERVETFTGTRAIEEAALRVRSPRVLVFATHGHYQEIDSGQWLSTRVGRLSLGSAEGLNEEMQELLGQWFISSQAWSNPLLRSMLVLAGANRHHDARRFFLTPDGPISEAEARARGWNPQRMAEQGIDLGDGLLTAYEVTGMDLRGTELVALIACETGLGDIDAADGLTGLRHAFRMAGARSLITSLWEVPLDETLAQMDHFYGAWLEEGLPRYEAFRRSQLESLRESREKRENGHPFWWAGFVYVGEPD